MWTTKKAIVFLFAFLFLLNAPVLAQGDSFDGFDEDESYDEFSPQVANTGEADLTREFQLLRSSHAQTQKRYDEAIQRTADAKLNVAAIVPPRVAKIQKKLAARHDFSFKEITISELADRLRNDLDVNVRIDKLGLEDASIDLDADHLSLKAPGLSYRTALERLFQDLNLTFFVSEESGIVITNAATLCEPPTSTRVYPVWDLVRSPSSNDEDVADYDTLIDCITRIVDPDSWEDVGGPSTVADYKGVLSISTTNESHDDIVRLLAALRSEPVIAPSDKRQETIVTRDLAGTYDSDLQDKLAANVDFEFIDQGLSVVLQLLQLKYKIPIFLDDGALADEGMDDGEIVSVKFKNITLSNALGATLSELGLAYIVDGSVLRVTTNTVAEEALQNRVYACRPLIDAIDPTSHQPTSKELQQLAELISTSVEPDNWDFVGGTGTICAFPQRGLLVISNTESAHKKVHNLLSTLLNTRQAGNVGPSKQLAPSDVVTKAYILNDSLPDEDTRQGIVKLFQNRLANTDNEVNGRFADYSIAVVGKKLVVSHRRDAQRTIQSVLQKLGIVDSPETWGDSGIICGCMGGMGGGMMSGGGTMSGGMGSGMF